MGLPDESINSLPGRRDHFKNVYITPGSIRRTLQKLRQIVKPKEETSVNPPIRSKIFNSELEDLVQKVSERKKFLQTAVEQRIHLFPEGEDFRFSLLSGVYSSKENTGFMLDYILEEGKEFGIQSFLLGYLDSFSGLYQPLLQSGISPETSGNLYFHKRENSIAGSKGFLSFEGFPENVFLTKKFGKTELSVFRGIYFQKLENPALLFMVFLKKNHWDKYSEEKWETKIQELFQPIRAPLASLIVKQKEKKFPECKQNIYGKIINLSRAKLVNGDISSLYIIKILIKNYFLIENNLELKKEIFYSLNHILEQDERLIEVQCGEIIFLSSRPATEKVTQLLGSDKFKDFQFLISSSNYPNDETNFYLHF